MLPPGHLAGGYLATLGLLKLTSLVIPAKAWALDPAHFQTLLVLGALFGFLPDLDHFVTFIKYRALRIPEQGGDHRSLFTHTPFFWLVISAIVLLFTYRSAFGPYLAATILVSSWSHFFLDTMIHGVMLLWPFTTRKFAFFDLNLIPRIPQKSFWSYWWNFTKFYTHKVCFYLEILVIIIALTILIH